MIYIYVESVWIIIDKPHIFQKMLMTCYRWRTSMFRPLPLLFFPFSPLQINQFVVDAVSNVVVVVSVSIVIRLLHSHLNSIQIHSMSEKENHMKTNIQKRHFSLSGIQWSASFWQQVVSKTQNESIYKTILMFIFFFFCSFVRLLI